MSIKKNLLYFFFLFLRYFAIALGAIFFVLIISFIISWQSWRNFTREALSGKNNLSTALYSLQDRNWSNAKTDLNLAENNFQASGAAITELYRTWLPAKIGLGQAQLNDLELLNDSALIITRSALQASQLAENISAAAFNGKDNFQDLQAGQKAVFLESLIALEPELNGLKANLSLALFNIDRIHRFGILWPLRGQLQEVRTQLEQGQFMLTQSLPIIRLLPAFSGYPQAVHYLIMLQNNDEIRPTGGFLGTYVRADIIDFGKIERLTADDVYHLDMPSIGKTKYTPPTPISKYLKVENWYLRDANWSPDWPQSARQIQEMFQAESLAAGQADVPLDGIVGITPDFVADLLKITGPITVRGESYAPENMQALLQYNVEVAYKEEEISSWDRKNIINELISALKDKLITLPLRQYPELIASLDKSLKRGDLLLYFNDAGRQNIAKELGGSGEIKSVEGDYLMVVDANLAAFKSDAVMQKNLTYRVQDKKNGLTANLTLNYRHRGGFDWRTTRYRSYTRVLAPLGSQLIQIKGLEEATADIIDYDDINLGKHVFGFFWSIEPGQNKELILSYNLPNNLKNDFRENNYYSLYVQRQPGSRIASLSLAIETDKKIISAKPQDLNGEIKTQSAYWTISLEQDQKIKILTE